MIESMLTLTLLAGAIPPSVMLVDWQGQLQIRRNRVEVKPSPGDRLENGDELLVEGGALRLQLGHPLDQIWVVLGDFRIVIMDGKPKVSPTKGAFKHRTFSTAANLPSIRVEFCAPPCQEAVAPRGGVADDPALEQQRAICVEKAKTQKEADFVSRVAHWLDLQRSGCVHEAAESFEHAWSQSPEMHEWLNLMRDESIDAGFNYYTHRLDRCWKFAPPGHREMTLNIEASLGKTGCIEADGKGLRIQKSPDFPKFEQCVRTEAKYWCFASTRYSRPIVRALKLGRPQVRK